MGLLFSFMAAPTFSEIRLGLSGMQNDNLFDGSLGWISMGINIENEQ